MRATMDTLDVIEPVQARTIFETNLPAVFRGPVKKQNAAAPRKQKEEKWASTLDPLDLRCLLAVLETALIPRLVRDYSPAESAPPLITGSQDI